MPRIDVFFHVLSLSGPLSRFPRRSRRFRPYAIVCKSADVRAAVTLGRPPTDRFPGRQTGFSSNAVSIFLLSGFSPVVWSYPTVYEIGTFFPRPTPSRLVHQGTPFGRQIRLLQINRRQIGNKK